MTLHRNEFVVELSADDLQKVAGGLWIGKETAPGEIEALSKNVIDCRPPFDGGCWLGIPDGMPHVG